MNIDAYWPNWRDEIGTQRRMTQHILSKQATPETEELDQILANQDTLFKAVFWLLAEAAKEST